MKKQLLLALALLVTSSPIFAVKEFYSVSRSARALGMGGAFYGLSDDQGALFYNPAGLSMYRGDGQLMLSLQAQASDKLFSAAKAISDSKNADVDDIARRINEFQGTPLYGEGNVMLYYLTRGFGMGFQIVDTKFDVAFLGKNLDTTVDVTAINDSAAFIGFGFPLFGESLHFGVSGKAIFRAGGTRRFGIDDIAKGTNLKIDPQQLGGYGIGIDADAGFAYELPWSPGIFTRVSLVFNNILATDFNISRKNNPPGLSRYFSLGTHTVFGGWWWFDNFHLLVDLAEFHLGGQSDENYGARYGHILKHLNIGLEAPLNGWFTPRIGIHQGYWTAGLGLNLKLLKLDFATYAEELGAAPGRLPSRRYVAQLQIGWGSNSPDPILVSCVNQAGEMPPPPPVDEQKLKEEAAKKEAEAKLEEEKKKAEEEKAKAEEDAKKKAEEEKEKAEKAAEEAKEAAEKKAEEAKEAAEKAAEESNKTE